jgi:hypothetical protein
MNKKISLIPAAVGSVNNDVEASYYFDETLKDTNGSIQSYLVILISDEKNKSNPNIKLLKKLRAELKEYPKKPLFLGENKQFQNRAEAELFLKPLLKKEKELFQKID